MCDVIKRDGSRAKFDIHKIIRVMELAFKAENKTVFPEETLTEGYSVS